MKFIFSFFIVLAMTFGFATEAEAHTIRTTTVERVCSVERQYFPAHHNKYGHWVSGYFKNVTVCRNVPRTVVRRHHHHLFRHHHHRHHHRHGLRVTLRL